MTNRGCLLGIALLSTLMSCTAAQNNEGSNAEQEIRAMYEQYSAAVKSRNVDTIMAFYPSDESLVAYDAFPPRQYRGAAAYRKAYEGFFAAYPGPVTSEISDVRIVAEGTLAFASAIDRWLATGGDGKSTEMVFRTTVGLRKVNGRWLIVHEHLSVPVDPVTGKADFLSKQ